MRDHSFDEQESEIHRAFHVLRGAAVEVAHDLMHRVHMRLAHHDHARTRSPQPHEVVGDLMVETANLVGDLLLLAPASGPGRRGAPRMDPHPAGRGPEHDGND